MSASNGPEIGSGTLEGSSETLGAASGDGFNYGELYFGVL